MFLGFLLLINDSDIFVGFLWVIDLGVGLIFFIFIMCKALIIDKLSEEEDFYQWISVIILLFTEMSDYNCLFISLLSDNLNKLNYNFDISTGLGIYNGLFLINIILNYYQIKLCNIINITFFNLKYYTIIISSLFYL